MNRFIHLILAILFFSLLSCNHSLNEKKKIKHRFQLNCNASHEGSEIDNTHNHIVTNDSLPIPIILRGVKSTEIYRTAPSSILMEGKTLYSFVTTIDNVERDDRYKISIWRKSSQKKGSLIIEARPKGILYKGATLPVEKSEDGWEKLELDIIIPPLVHTIKFYALKGDADSVYFDDLSIIKIENEYKNFENEPKLHLYFTEEAMNNFEEEREEAFREGVHFSNEKWTKGILSDEQEIYPIKSRLKGDWLDHIQGRKWSFRIKLRKNMAFNRMTTFSVLNPKTRKHLHEFIAHNLFLQEGLLTTRYSFKPLYLNKESLGIYALEEHFEKQMIEFNLRKEGLILKLDENPNWRANALYLGNNKKNNYQYLPRYEVSRALPFSLNKILKDSILRTQFLVAQSLIYQFKNRNAPIEELFDIDKLARFLAIADIVNGKHGTVWHNLRFYYNPALCLLEPINYDNFSGGDVGSAFIHALSIKSNEPKLAMNNLFSYFFLSEEVIGLYIDYLKKYSEESFIRAYNLSQKKYIDQYLALIQEEFPDYYLDSTFLLNNAKDIRNSLPRLIEKYNQEYFTTIKLKDKVVSSSYVKDSTILSTYVNCYYYKQNQEAKIVVENYNGEDLKLIGLMGENNKILYQFPKNSIVKSFTNRYADTIISIPYYKEATKLVFQPIDTNWTIVSELSLWQKNTAQSPYQQLLYQSREDTNSLFKKRNDSLILPKGNYTLSDKVLIPKGKQVVFEAGVNLNMVNQAAILSYSTVHLNGTKENPISIYSSDQTSNGFSVLQAKDQSKIVHTSFSGHNTFSYKGWSLSGAINFYESDVVISNTTFEKNVCEDALNIIRSDFTIDSVTFSNIYADAFDSDFSTGVVKRTTFENIGNDAIDFSTSQIQIESCSIVNVNDKGISGGEASTLKVKNCRIENCNIGVASKDLSLVQLESISIIGCEYGLVSFKKKPEYGSANIVSKQLELKDCSNNYLIEKGSSLTMDNRKIIGSKGKVAEIFY